jgi:hypothetical protein
MIQHTEKPTYARVQQDNAQALSPECFVGTIYNRLAYRYGTRSANLLLKIYQPYIHAMAPSLAYEQVFLFIQREVTPIVHLPKQQFFELEHVDIRLEVQVVDDVVVSHYYCIRDQRIEYHQLSLEDALHHVETHGLSTVAACAPVLQSAEPSTKTRRPVRRWFKRYIDRLSQASR